MKWQMPGQQRQRLVGSVFGQIGPTGWEVRGDFGQKWAVSGNFGIKHLWGLSGVLLYTRIHLGLQIYYSYGP